MEDCVKELYELKPMQVKKLDEGLYVRRVPGGWIFETPDSDGHRWTPVFVPFDNEFQERPKKDFFSDDVIRN